MIVLLYTLMAMTGASGVGLAQQPVRLLSAEIPQLHETIFAGPAVPVRKITRLVDLFPDRAAGPARCGDAPGVTTTCRQPSIASGAGDGTRTARTWLAKRPAPSAWHPAVFSVSPPGAAGRPRTDCEL